MFVARKHKLGKAIRQAMNALSAQVELDHKQAVRQQGGQNRLCLRPQCQLHMQEVATDMYAHEESAQKTCSMLPHQRQTVTTLDPQESRTACVEH